MTFSLSEWLMRRKFGAQVRNAGRPIEHSRIANPYHSVSIEAGAKACGTARQIEGKRFLSSSAPMLPVRGCTQATCNCRYVHHNDRRSSRDRRVNFANPHAHKMSERREGSGRRMTD